jgi:hypothetical protein
MLAFLSLCPLSQGRSLRDSTLTSRNTEGAASNPRGSLIPFSQSYATCPTIGNENRIFIYPIPNPKMNEHTLPLVHKQMNMIYKSLGIPTLEESLAKEGSDPPSVDERNEELYDRDDHRQFHVPITLVRNTFASVMAKSAEEAEVIVQNRLRRQGEEPTSHASVQVGPAIEA